MVIEGFRQEEIEAGSECGYIAIENRYPIDQNMHIGRGRVNVLAEESSLNQVAARAWGGKTGGLNSIRHLAPDESRILPPRFVATLPFA